MTLTGMDTLISCQEKPYVILTGRLLTSWPKDGVWAEPQEAGVQGTGVSCLGLGQSPGNT